ncbi:MAG: hypothetical protein ACKOZT_13080 [Cyanobium sp.]
MSRCFPPSVFQFGRDHLHWSFETHEGRERMAMDLELLADLHRLTPPIDSAPIDQAPLG